MSERTIKERLQAFGLNQVVQLLNDDPDRNIPKVMDWVDRLDREDVLVVQREFVRDMIEDQNSLWYGFTKSLFTDIDAEVRKTLFSNFIVNAAVIGQERLKKARQQYQCNIPWTILIDPTSACNLGCTGCWAAEYGDKMNMSYETLDSIIRQGKELGIYMYIYSGGEPLVRKQDLLRLCETHSDCVFLAFTNGTLIDEAFAEEMLRIRNLVPAISIEGFEEETDDRRGSGTYQQVIEAMRLLKEKKLPFGASCCFTSKNTEIIGSEEFIDSLVDLGCKFAWFFTYMPIGAGAPTDLLATPSQREFMYRQIRAFRYTKPIFNVDFFHDAEYIGGCIAGGRYYHHINANGDVEPCAFIHYSDSNIYEKTLLQAYQSPLFMQYHMNQPFNENHLRACPLLDNYGRLADMVEASGAHSTDMEQPEDVHQLCAKCQQAAVDWAPTADRLWQRSHSLQTVPEQAMAISVSADHADEAEG